MPPSAIASRAGVASTLGRRSAIVNVKVARSLVMTLASASATVTVTVAVVGAVAVGVPHTVRAAMQSPVPSSSKDKPAGRPVTV